MWKDFYSSKNKSQKNPYEYNIDNLKKITPELIHYKEISQIKPEIDDLFAISIDCPAEFKILEAYLLANDFPFKVTTGSPAQIASLHVVPPLYGNVSKKRSQIL